MSNSGSIASARAMATRCFSPPDNWRGFLSSSDASSFTTASSSWTRFRIASRSHSPITWSGSARIAPIRCIGFRLASGSWNTICIRRRNERRIAGRTVARSCDRNRSSPPAAGTMPAMARASVVLPEPDSPTSARTSPPRTFSVQLRTACTTRPPDRSVTESPATSSKGSPVMAHPPAIRSRTPSASRQPRAVHACIRGPAHRGCRRSGPARRIGRVA